MHVVGVFFFLGQHLLEEHARRRILVREVSDHVAVGLDGDALGDQVLLDHVHQVLAFDELGSGPLGHPVGVQVRLAAELVDALGDPDQVLLLLARVFLEFLFHRFARDAGRGDRVIPVAEDADDLRRHGRVEQADRRLDVAPVVGREGALFQVLSGALANGLDVGGE